MDTSTPLVIQWHRQYPLCHSYPRINQTLPQIIHILHFCLVDSLRNYARDLVNWIELMAVW